MAAVTFDDLVGMLPVSRDLRAALLRPGVTYIDEPNTRFVMPTLSVDSSHHEASAILISAPAAVGKSTVARQLAYRTGALLWDLSAFQVGTDTFSGTILNTFGLSAPLALELIEQGKLLIILDALDEAQIRAGSQNFDAFLQDLTSRLRSPRRKPVVILLARGETAELVSLWFEEKKISLTRFRLDFFDQEGALDFIARRLDFKRTLDGRPNLRVAQPRAFQEARDRFFNLVYGLLGVSLERAWEHQTVRSFLGYAPVLEAVADYLDVQNYQNLLNELGQLQESARGGPEDLQWRFLAKIIAALLQREKTKVVSAVRAKLESVAIHSGWKRWDRLFDSDEQCARVLSRALKIPVMKTLDMPQALASQYTETLAQYLPEHVFVGDHRGFANVVCQEYVYAWALTQAPQELRRRLRPTLGDYRPSPVLGRFVIMLGRDAEGETIIDGEDAGLVYESFLSQVSRRGQVNMELFGNGADVELIIGRDDEVREDVVLRISVSQEGVQFRHRLADADVYVESVLRLGSAGQNLILGPRLDVSCRVVRLVANSVEVDADGDVKLNAETYVCESHDVRVKVFNEGKGRLKVHWPDLAYPWVQYRDEGLGSYPGDFDAERAEVLHKFLLMFRRQRARRIDTVRRARWSQGQLVLRQELIDRALRHGVVREDGPYYIFNSRFDSMKGIFDEEDRSVSSDARKFAADFLEARNSV